MGRLFRIGLESLNPGVDSYRCVTEKPAKQVRINGLAKANKLLKV